MKVLLLARGTGSLVAASKMHFTHITSLHIWENDELFASIRRGVSATVGGDLQVLKLPHAQVQSPSRYGMQAMLAAHFAEAGGYNVVLTGWSSAQVRHGALLNLNHTLASLGSSITVHAPLLLMTEAELLKSCNTVRELIG